MKTITTVTYHVFYLENGQLVNKDYSTFAQAAGVAGALTNVLRFISATLKKTDSDGGYYSEHGFLYKYAANQSERVKCNPAFITKLMEVGA